MQMMAYALGRIKEQNKLILKEIAEIKQTVTSTRKRYETVDEMIKDYLEQN